MGCLASAAPSVVASCLEDSAKFGLTKKAGMWIEVD